MISDRYVWLIWSAAFLLPWALLYWLRPQDRRGMWLTSVFIAPFGLTEPLFVPEYWNPPSLFDLAQRTGFDIESLVFCFAIGGVGSVLYNALAGRHAAPVPACERHRHRHRFHGLAMLTPFPVFLALYALPWNAIYPGIVAMVSGAAATILCRPDLRTKTVIGGGLFLGYYAVFMSGLQLFAPGYIERVWNLDALSGILVGGIPLEELLFAFAFGMYWAGVYEHASWRRPAADPQPAVLAR